MALAPWFDSAIISAILARRQGIDEIPRKPLTGSIMWRSTKKSFAIGKENNRERHLTPIAT
jgi:hypothetical protein